MKFFKKFTALFLVLLSLVSMYSCENKLNTENGTYKELGIASEKNYKKGINAFYIGDLHIFGDKMYIGDGDYTENTGPVNIMALNLKNGKFENTGKVPDEAILRFKEIDGKLICPGTDPREDWELGNYYVLNGDKWDAKRCIPNGIHCYDIAKYDNKYFFAMGTKDEFYPCYTSYDGENFTEVQFMKDGKLMDKKDGIINRCLDFYELNNELYVTYLYMKEDRNCSRYEMYKYDKKEEKFEFLTDIKSKIAIKGKVGGEFVLERVNFKNKIFIATGYLVETCDMVNFKKADFSDDVTVWDFKIENDVLYMLCSEKNENGYTVSVMENKTGNTENFEELISFDYEIPAVSFEKYGNKFYFAMNNGIYNHDKNGMIIESIIEKDSQK